MNSDMIFTGIGATLFGTVIGALLTCWLTFYFQKRLLKQQLEFQKELANQQIIFLQKQAEADTILRQKIYDEWHEVFKEFRNMVNTRAAQLVGQLSSLYPPRDGR